MSKKRLSSRAANKIASERISVLYGLSMEAHRNGNEERSERYIDLARRIGQKTNTPFPKDVMYCKKCNRPLRAGDGCRVRVGDGRVKITCLRCGDVRRIPYGKE